MERVLDCFTEMREGMRYATGFMGSILVTPMYEGDEMTAVRVCFRVPRGKRKDLGMHVEFTKDRVTLENVTGKRGITVDDVIAVAEKYAEVVQWYELHKNV